MTSRRVKIFAKGNVDVYDSLHSCRVSGKLLWNGVNEVVRPRHPGTSIRLVHETALRSEAVLAADGVVPPEVEGFDALLGSYPVASQFSRAVYDTDADAIVLSILPDVAAGLLQHRRSGFFFHPEARETWPACLQAWLTNEFVRLDQPTAEDAMARLERIVERIRESTEAPILVYNLSTVLPGETIHSYVGFEDAASIRIRRFNLALIDLSARTGVSIVDVDTVLARAGAEHLKLGVYHLTAAGYRLVAEEVVRILEDVGVLT